MPQHVAVTGKGGIGKTTIAANIAAALAEAGSRVMLIGCNATADSGALLCGCRSARSLLDVYHSKTTPKLADVISAGYRGIGCIEVGDSLEDSCPGSSIGNCLQLLHEMKAVEEFVADVVIYDMPAEIGCTWLAGRLNVFLHRAFVVTSADLPSLYAANALFRIMARYPHIAAELVANGLAGSFEESMTGDFAQQINASVAGVVPKSLVVRHSELYGKTVLERAPQSNQATLYRRLAHHLLNKPVKASIPRPFPVDALKQWARGWGERLGEVEFGVLQDGAGI